MLDHRQCQAFLAVAETGSFEKAAELLCITPAAVSLRVQALEKHLAQILLIRGRPCQVTQAGQEVLYYLNNMQRFEQHLLQRLQGASAEYDFVKVILGVNADSLATWLLPALQPVLLQQKILLELKLDDQSQTYLLLQEGTVNACISIESEPMKGCQVQCLGSMRYRMVASAAFAQQWFKQGVNRHTLRQAPAVIFNVKDRLHVDLLEQHFGLMIGSYPYHFVPSSEAFVDMIQRGLGYGVVPELQLGTSLQDQTLIDLLPDLYQDVVLYWHDWQRQSEPLNLLRQQVVQQSQQYLLQV